MNFSHPALDSVHRICLQVAGVQYVIDTVIFALLANPDRKFAYAEMVRCRCPTPAKIQYQTPLAFDFVCLKSVGSSPTLGRSELGTIYVTADLRLA